MEVTSKKIRRSKRQAVQEVSPALSLKQKKKQKVVPEVSSIHKDVEEDEVIAEEAEENGESIAEEAEEHSHHEEEQTIPTAADAQTEQSTTKKRKRRGPTRMHKIAKRHGDKLAVRFNDIGNHVGRGSITLSSFVGIIVREHVSVLLDDWRHLDQKTKDMMWEEIQGRFDLNEPWHKDVILRQMCKLWRSSKSRLVAKIRNLKSKSEILDLKPINIPCASAWMSWVKSRQSIAFQEKSEIFKKMRKGQIPQTTSRKGMARLEDEMKQESSEPIKVTRSKVWIAGHTHSDGRPVREEFAETIEKIKAIDSEIGSTSTDNVRADAVSQVLGKDKPGRIRGLGRGATITKLDYLKARDSHVKELEASYAELKTDFKKLQNMFSEITGKKIVGSKSDLSDVSKGGVRCQILDWQLNEDVVVGEGEFCSSEHTYKIGRIPLGPNAAAVLVNSVSDKTTSLWRPLSQTIGSLHQAIGKKVAWPFVKIILDDDTTQPPDTMMSEESDGDVGIVDIYDYWRQDDEVIAQGILMSTKPEELVHGMPLGLKAGTVKITQVFKAGAYIWRPTPSVPYMTDALNETIAWPLDRLKLQVQSEESSRKSPIEESTRKSVEKSGSPSIGNSSKGGGKPKCAVMDSGNSGQRVAIGRLFSNDPAATVHCTPIGPNASKVLIEIPKVNAARVWRESPEVQTIADASGTFVAWPNDKIIML